MKSISTVLLLSVFSTQIVVCQTLAEQNYPPRVTTVRVDSTNLPLVWITTTGQLSRTQRIPGSMKVISNADGINYGDTVAHPGQHVEYDGPVQIRWRGNSSFGKDGSRSKKPMSVIIPKYVHSNKQQLRYELLAPWQDQSYIRDILTNEMARGGYVFVPTAKYCEVFLDGIYYGVYILSERFPKGSATAPLWDYGEDGDGNPIEDTTGDFIVETDRSYNEWLNMAEPHYTSKHHPVYPDGKEIPQKTISYQYKDPDFDDYQRLMSDPSPLHNAIADMEDAFASEDYRDLYADYIDVESFMDFEIAQELSNNIDGYRQSTPMWKYSATHAAALGDNARWKLALWDFNLAYFHNPNDHMQPERADWRYNANDILVDSVLDKDALNPFYWYKLMNDSNYVNGIRARYTQRRLSSYSEDRITSICDSLDEVLGQGAVARDNKAWNNRFSGRSNAVAFVKEFIAARLAWMDERWYDESLLSDISLTGSTFWKDGFWNTICLPFRLSDIQGTPLAGATIKTLESSAFADGTLTLNFTEGSLTSLEAGKPYIVKWPVEQDITDPVFEDMIAKNVSGTTIETEYVDFKGTTVPMAFNSEDRSILYLGSENMLYYPSGNVQIGAFHGYFELKKGLFAGDSANAVRHLRFNLGVEEDFPSAIEHVVEARDVIEDVWYRPDGHRLSSVPLQKGIYISNKKKIIIQ